ncbi:Ctr copper transporter [Hyaloscypha hepaticicola]|uniref:Copper transport protein n=1 Tax=Hyaloscypha hepaticicola TaxID=2082293 RepID=A0A2J6Q253_9HELO|nr:Ctr copper transporter [Hyaloscypha hepaticicola]
MGGDCKISMLWNWYTLDACSEGFISSSWHITSRGMFAGSCVGVILLVMSLEFLRRASREYDRYIVRQAQLKQQQQQSTDHGPELHSDNGSVKTPALASTAPTSSNVRGIRPNVFQQIIRALFHMLQFAVAYFIMLLAMYYNGYIIICIIIGSFLGVFVFSWEPISLL